MGGGVHPIAYELGCADWEMRTVDALYFYNFYIKTGVCAMNTVTSSYLINSIQVDPSHDNAPLNAPLRKRFTRTMAAAA